MKIVQISLYQGDARDLSSQACIMGHNNPLKKQLEVSTRRQFEPFSLPRRTGPHVTGHILDVPRHSDCPWYYAASLKTKFRHDIWERPSTDLTVFIAYLHLFLWARDFTIVPLSWRHPQRVAASTLFSIWFLAYFSKEVLHTTDDRFRLTFNLATIDSLQPYEDLLYPDSGKLWDYIESVYDATPTLFSFGARLKREAVIFDVKTR